MSNGLRSVALLNYFLSQNRYGHRIVTRNDITNNVKPVKKGDYVSQKL